MNLEGEQFLDMIEKRGLQIANGNIKGDELEEFTYSDIELTFLNVISKAILT